jgi:cytochrome P450
MTSSEIAETNSILIVAGSETTATALTGGTYYLLKNPCVLKKLQDEVRGAFAKAEDMSIASLARLPYLNLVLRETMRIYPPAPGTFARKTGSTGEIISGHWVPPNVSFSHRSPIKHEDTDTTGRRSSVSINYRPTIMPQTSPILIALSPSAGFPHHLRST